MKGTNVLLLLCFLLHLLLSSLLHIFLLLFHCFLLSFIDSIFTGWFGSENNAKIQLLKSVATTVLLFGFGIFFRSLGLSNLEIWVPQLLGPIELTSIP